MGARGPRPELPELKKLKGNPGKRRISEAGIPTTGELFVPDHLSTDAQACIELVRSCMPPGVYGRTDAFLLSAFATAWSIHKQAVEALSDSTENPMVEVGSAGNRVPSPWVKILNQQAQIMASLGDRLGLDPKARAGLKMPDPEKPKSKFDGLMN